jgi:hypothetical protein
LWRFEAVGGFGGDKEGAEKVAEGEVDRDDDQKFWEVVPESRPLSITVILLGIFSGFNKRGVNVKDRVSIDLKVPFVHLFLQFVRTSLYPKNPSESRCWYFS